MLSDLTATLPGRLRFSQGNYDACENDLDGATAVTYRVNGRVDGSGGGDPTAAVRAALEGAGFEIAAHVRRADRGRHRMVTRSRRSPGSTARTRCCSRRTTPAATPSAATWRLAYAAEKDPLKLG